MQQRKKRIKTTTGNTPSTAQFVWSAAQNRKRNPPDQQTKATAVRSTSATTKQTKTDANKNIVRQTNTHQRRLSRGAVRSDGRYALERLEYTLQEKKHTGRQPRSMIQPIKPRKTAEQTILISKHTEKHFASTVRVGTKAHCATKKQTHASHRAKKQKTGFNPNFTRKLTEGARKTQKNTVFHVKHSILYLLIFHKHIGYHIAKSRNCKKKQ